MITKKKTFILLLALFCIQVFSQKKINLELKNTLEKIVSNKKAEVGISIIGSGNDVVSINDNKLYPMLSTVKFTIALAILDQIEKGKLSMNQKIFIKKEELLEDTWSPFKKENPNGNISITLEEAMKWMISYSDNNLTDILLRIIGGTETVQTFIDSENFIIKNNEEDDSQFVNQIKPNYATLLLKEFSEGKILNKTHTKWLYQAMLNNTTGMKRLKGKLPANIEVSHRTGTSFTNNAGMTGAINDFGIIELPNNKKIYIAVFVHDTFESFDDSEEMIADIAKATYDFYLNTKD
ncbi:class A beta-lactamase [Chryseobacterium sp. C-71]|uniref:class A beta-lactamase n=1 Tax=Chryseobacterium sp. C-71 TaxID=2893882 RepID=UPI001E43B598|nr:class A beta-lactamase [Chryseobacterium sp. C-71]UFH32502.1 class A beta-lactamase [Chryseobacterium sp. C-71]